MQIEKLVDKVLLSLVAAVIMSTDEDVVFNISRKEADEYVKDAAQIVGAAGRWVEDERDEIK